ncbi:MAG: hypothetical protein GX444_00420, partial [Myxococcales bacterium]|nr:hypothetical protein [Myxococcales bacterium]
DQYLFNFQYLLNEFNYFRSDRRLNEIYEIFKGFFTEVSGDKFNLAGYSAGGQFVSRYMMCYPENLNLVALGGAKSYLFPLLTYPYPFGLDCSNLNSFFDKPPEPHGVAQGAPEWWANDLRKMDWNKKLNLLMDLNVFHLVGIDDRENEGHDREDIQDPLDDSRLWQGTNRWERAFNYHFEMRRAEYRQRKNGVRDQSKAFQMVFVPLMGNHEIAHSIFPNWLKACWEKFPAEILYAYDGYYRKR